ncbi:MAG: nitroreductase family protein, partial [Halobacteriota archaeon]
TLLYAAWNEGVASCPMGGWDADAVREEFDVPETWKPLLMVTLGYVDREGDEWNLPRKYRRDPADFVHHESIDV